MLEIGMNGVIKNYGFKNVLNGVNLEIMTGDRVAIVGRNGAGKSTILKIVAGQEAPGQGIVTIRKGVTVGYLEQIPELSAQGVTAREVLMEPFDQLFSIERKLRALEQEMATQADPDTLEELMRRYAHQQNLFVSMDGYAIEENLARIATGFGLTELLDRPFNVLSGGQKTVVKLACTILRKPDILLLDEPTNHLDVRTLEWFETYLAKYKGTVLIVSHDRYFLDKVAQKTIILDAGVCQLFHGNYTFSQREQERLLLLEFEQYKNQQKKVEAMRAAIKRFHDWGVQADNPKFHRKAKELEKRLEKMELIDKPQLEKPKIPIAFKGERTGREALKLKDLSLSIGDLRLLDSVSLTLFYQEKACLTGDNGTGKTTLFRALLGELPLPEGAVRFAPSAKVGYIPQETRFDDGQASILDVFRQACPCPEHIARSILAKYSFYADDVFKRVSALSGGEKVLLKLAILVRQEINFLLLDEPTNHIDIETREMLEEALLDFGGTILFVSHDRYFVQRVATRVLGIEARAIIERQKHV
ncbi:MAG: ATP-binding cassette domain-containing protein [Clostridia bacterium]|nr:ATP-binding cassette domain-containing protein [Clostridia bacterium]